MSKYQNVLLKVKDVGAFNLGATVRKIGTELGFFGALLAAVGITVNLVGSELMDGETASGFLLTDDALELLDAAAKESPLNN